MFEDSDELKEATRVLKEVLCILKGPEKKNKVFHYLKDYYRPETNGVTRTLQACVIGDLRWAPVWMTYNPKIPALELITEHNSVVSVGGPVLLTIDLNHPRSLVRAYLREQIKKSVEVYSERRRLYYQREVR